MNQICYLYLSICFRFIAMKQILLFLFLLGISSGMSMASNDTDPTIRDSVRIKLNQPCEDVGELLLSVNDFILSHAQEDAQLRFDLIRQEVLPFALKKENQKAYKGIAWLYFNLSLLYEEWEKHVEALAMMDSAVYWIDKSGDRARQARLYYAYGDRQIYCGSVAKGHEYYYKSIKLYEELGGYEKEISACFFQLATGYLQMLDMDGLNRIVEKMTELNKRKTLIPCSYDLYSVLTTKYSMLLDEHPENKSFLDSIIYYSHKSIELIEKHGDELPGTMPAWNYYNLACIYDDKFDPPLYDSIAYYLDKAIEVKKYTESVRREVNISVFDLQAWVFYQQKQYAQAEQKMMEVIRLLEESGDVNSLITEYGEAYGLLVKIYEETNRPVLALKYQKLMNDIHRKRFNQEKMEALKELEVKYEVEKKENQITWLEEKNQAARKTIILVVSFLIALSFVLILILVLFRLRKRNLEQQVYESALLAELKQDELAQSSSEKKRLQEEYDKLSALARENEDLAKKYEVQLSTIKQQINQGTVASVIGKMVDIVEHSLLDAETKQLYAGKLLSLDTDEMEKLFLPVGDKMTSMDMKYILCFYVDMDAKDIGLMFNVEAASVYTVRYRIRKKFKDYPSFKFLMG